MKHINVVLPLNQHEVDARLERFNKKHKGKFKLEIFFSKAPIFELWDKTTDDWDFVMIRFTFKGTIGHSEGNQTEIDNTKKLINMIDLIDDAIA